MKFVPGQRWISDTEPELGLGTVLGAQGNRVTLLFIATSERRTYAQDNSPLTRVRFAVGDAVESVEGWTLTVSEVLENQGLLTYEGTDEDGTFHRLEELDVSHFLQFNRPQDRLFAGQIDGNRLFELRYATLLNLGRIERSPVRGLVGPRTSLLPHQLYIAHEVATRHAPRVMLADEVGLGKTIEAGMILHHQILSGRIERALIVVPEPLLHQWLVEMLRRFNLRFALIDADACEDAFEGGANPFVDSPLCLCAMELLTKKDAYSELAVTAGWGMLVVDEAHHLEWKNGLASPQYNVAAALAQDTPGLLLLTATPEQFGKAAHFARLRLLDPDRFHDYEQFLDDEAHYQSLAHLIEPLLGKQRLRDDQLAQLRTATRQDKADSLLVRLNQPREAQAARDELLRLLLDRHGTGRILFRNTRLTVQGFPARELHAYPVPCPDFYLADVCRQGSASLHPETARREVGDQPWWRIDTRVACLVRLIRGMAGAKALIICADTKTAMDLEDALRILGGVSAAVFNERMSIVARDRAAAWFADQEDGAQVLVCSEIGSEGRNFQFAHHLVLFDLPYNPDLLEQRIGRLDRIGQSQTIHIHVIYLEGTAQAVLFRWYRDGLGAFEHPCPAGLAVLQKLKDQLDPLLVEPDTARLGPLLALAARYTEDIRRELHEGRDRLLELNSCRLREAQSLVEAIDAFEREHALWDYMEQVFDGYGITVEEHSEQCYILTPGDNMMVPHFPDLPDDGVTVTLSRPVALAREDMLFLTWEHPMVSGAADLILTSGHGNTAVSLAFHPQLPAGRLLLETVFLVECAAPKALQIGRFLPSTLVRVLVDTDLADVAARYAHDDFRDSGQAIDRVHAAELVRAQQKSIARMLQAADAHAKKQLPKLVAAAAKQMLDSLTGELKRLNVLKKLNPNVRGEEIEHLKQTVLDSHAHLQSAQLRLDSIKVILTS